MQAAVRGERREKEVALVVRTRSPAEGPRMVFHVASSPSGPRERGRSYVHPYGWQAYLRRRR